MENLKQLVYKHYLVLATLYSYSTLGLKNIIVCALNLHTRGA